ncbi:hypothetical protein ADU37_CDS19790 [Thermococcus sp. 2319x1]|nr:hypothetical protein ADU37_CDS19790 [Thermococcus sp. 2319x1]
MFPTTPFLHSFCIQTDFIGLEKHLKILLNFVGIIKIIWDCKETFQPAPNRGKGEPVWKMFQNLSVLLFRKVLAVRVSRR